MIGVTDPWTDRNRLHNVLMEPWRQYQERAAQFFRTLGQDAKTDQTIIGVRGKHDVDLAVRSRTAGIEQLWVVECKLWQRAVSKLHVANLAYIVQDVGADRGILLSEKGFQSGAIRLAEGSNITLTSLADLSDKAVKERRDDNALLRLRAEITGYLGQRHQVQSSIVTLRDRLILIHQQSGHTELANRVLAETYKVFIGPARADTPTAISMMVEAIHLAMARKWPVIIPVLTDVESDWRVPEHLRPTLPWTYSERQTEDMSKVISAGQKIATGLSEDNRKMELFRRKLVGIRMD